MSKQTAPDRTYAVTQHPEAFFESVEGGYAARPHARSPWSEDLVHGRLVMGLMAREAEHHHMAEGWYPTRMTTDLFRPIPMGTLTLTTRCRRRGKRLLLVEVVASVGRVHVAASTIQALRSSPVNSEVHPSPAPFNPPHPEALESSPQVGARYLGEVRRVERPDEPERRFAWFRDHCELVDGMENQRFARVAAAADWVSPFTNFGPGGLAFINADVTLYLSRLPVGQWIGFDTVDHQVAGGIAISSCALYDTTGRVGTAASAALPY